MADEKRVTRAFAGGKYMRLMGGITKLANHESRLGKLAFTADELRDLFILEWQRKALTVAYELTEGGPAGSQSLYVEIENPMPMRWDNPRMVFNFGWATCKEGFLVPVKGYSVERPGKILAGAGPLRWRFERAVLNESRVAYEWGLVQWVFNQLNDPEWNTTPAQIRYVWSALVPILRAAKEDELADQLSEPSPRAGDSARCPPWVLPFIKPTYDIIAKATMLRDVSAPPLNAEITYKLYVPSFHVGNGRSFLGYVPS